MTFISYFNCHVALTSISLDLKLLFGSKSVSNPILSGISVILLFNPIPAHPLLIRLISIINIINIFGLFIYSLLYVCATLFTEIRHYYYPTPYGFYIVISRHFFVRSTLKKNIWFNSHTIFKRTIFVLADSTSYKL